MQCAVVQYSDNIVINIIMANPYLDKPPVGCFLIDITGVSCGIGWVYDPATNTFTDPNPPPPEE